MSKIKSCFFILLLFLYLGQITISQATALPDFTKLVEQSAPSVVNISTSKKIASYYDLSPDLNDIPPMYRDFFQGQVPNSPESQYSQSLGSGFIISSDGYILTNNHVVQGADEIRVKLSDRREFTAKLIGADNRTDIALLKVEANNLPQVKIGKINTLKVGEWVMAIGSPFGFDHSVTAGIVSAKGRSLGAESNYVPFIQTDVAINPGNSGGPLFNLEGEVIGINSQILTRSGGFMGLSFAIPIDVAMSVAEQIKATGKVQRAWLGIMIQEVSKDLAESFGLEKPEGALIARILKNSPAADSGLQVGDIVLTVNGQMIQHSADLPHIVGMLKPGSEINMQLIRAGKEQNIVVKTGVLPNDNNNIASLLATSKKVQANILGIIIGNLTANQKKILGVNQGVVIENVPKESLGYQLGLATNDVITHLNNQPVLSVSNFEKTINKLSKGKMLAMGIIRDNHASFITFRIIP